MKQINPLYLLISLATILLLMLFSLSSVKSDLNEVKHAIEKTENIANEIVSLKKSWGDKKRSKAELLKILNNTTLKSAGVSYKVDRSKVVIEADSIASKEFTYLLNKLFNTSLNISSLKVRSLDKHHVSLSVEVSL